MDLGKNIVKFSKWTHFCFQKPFFSLAPILVVSKILQTPNLGTRYFNSIAIRSYHYLNTYYPASVSTFLSFANNRVQSQKRCVNIFFAEKRSNSILRLL